MRRPALLSVLVVVAVLSVALAGCYPVTVVTGSGRLITKNFPITGFTGVDASSAFQVQVTRGDSYNVSVTVDDNLQDRLDVRQTGQDLHIGLTPGTANLGNATLRAQVTMPDLARVNASGAAGVTLTGFKSSADFSGEASGASHIDGDLQAGAVGMRLTGASQTNLTGTGTTLTLDASGASRGNLSNFAVDKATVTLSGASSASVNAKSNLSYDLSGASHLDYSGSPSIGAAQSSGASSATQR